MMHLAHPPSNDIRVGGRTLIHSGGRSLSAAGGVRKDSEGAKMEIGDVWNLLTSNIYRRLDVECALVL